MQRKNELSPDELLEKFKLSSKKLDEAMEKMLNAFNVLSKATNEINKKLNQDKFLEKHSRDYLQKIDTIKEDFENLANKLQNSFDRESNIYLIMEFENKWNNAISINCELKIRIKTSSKMKVDLTKDDIDQASFNLTIEDLFDNFKFGTIREINKDSIEIFEEPTEKITRVINAQSEFKKTTSYQVLSFFNRHPIISSAGVILGSAAVGVAVALTTEMVAKTMGYTK